MVPKGSIAGPSRPGSPMPLLNLGILLKEKGDLDGAEEFYRRAIEAGDTKAMAALSILLRTQDHPDEADEWMQRARKAGWSEENE